MGPNTKTCISLNIYKSYKYRIYPTKSQANYLDQNFGAARFVWNQLVANFNSYSKCGPNRKLTCKILKTEPENFFLKDAISYALNCKLLDFEETKKQFFSKSRKTKLGRMKFKKKGISNDSFRVPGQAIKFNEAIDFEKQTIKLTKMSPIKMVVDRTFSGQLRSVTVSKNKCNQYYVSVLVSEEQIQKPRTNRSIGIDLGIKDLMILSDGTKVSNPKWFRKSQAKLAKQQIHLSRKQRGSKRYEKQRLKVAKVHLKISNQRSWFIHNLTTWLVSNYDTIVTENLKVSNMIKNHKLAKSIQDVSWSEITRQLEYKSNWYGKTFTKIDTFYPSSKTCSCCDHKLQTLDLSIREWTCPSCNAVHDRDLNAATNILNRGLNALYDFTSSETVDYKRREAVRPSLDALHPLMASSMKRLLA